MKMVKVDKRTFHAVKMFQFIRDRGLLDEYTEWVTYERLANFREANK